jgi:hypothetical protein
LKEMINEDPHAQGDPELFRGNVVFMTMLNDVKLVKNQVSDLRRQQAADTAAYLRRFPQGSVSIVGPGSSEIWYLPHFDKHAPVFMQILATAGHPVYPAEASLKSMSLIPCESKKTGETWFDFHFQDTTDNVRKMCALITHTSRLTHLDPAF